MLHEIATVQIDQLRPLAQFGTRASDDPAIALIDAHAACLHVLAWNCLRLGDDATIGRTEDRDALVSLARLLGAEPRPALSASATIAFTLDDFQPSPTVVTIPKGTGIASIPGQDELPQTFETDVAIEARVAWNEIQPLQDYAPDALAKGAESAVVAGIDVPVRKGDHILLRLGGELRLAAVTETERIVETVRRGGVEIKRDRTRIAFLPQREVADLGKAKPLPEDVLIVLGQRAAAFGATAPDARLMPKETQGTLQLRGIPFGWQDFVIGVPGEDGDYNRADLDAVYADAIKHRAIVFTAPGMAHAGTITDSEELSRADFGMSAKITRVALDGIPLKPERDEPSKEESKKTDEIHWAKADEIAFSGYRHQVRETVMYVETARAALFRDVVDRPLPADPQWLDVEGAIALPPGRKVVLMGQAWAGAPGAVGPPLAEVAQIDRTTATGSGTRLFFSRPVSGRFRAPTLTVNGNCAPASHGESLKGEPEILGSGGGGAALPRLNLAKGPLAYVRADNARGYAPAIEVRVDDRLYQEVPTLYGLPASARNFTVRQVAGKSEIQFAGRLSTGTYNVTARYRTGGGMAGLVDAGRLTMIVTPVLGVKSATNPLRSEGASDAATVDELREAAPRTVQTLDRVVSRADYEAFAREFGGIGKAMASEMREGMRSVVLITVADSAMRAPSPGSDIIAGLCAALAKAAAPGRKVIVQGFDDYLAVLEIALATEGDLPRKAVEEAVREALAEKFGKPTRRFGEALFISALLAVIQQCKGVRGARIKQWRRAIAEPFQLQSGVGEDGTRMGCPGPAIDHKAGLLSVDAARISFSEMDL